MLSRCFFTGPGERCRRAAIAALVAPVPARSRISASREVSPKRCVLSAQVAVMSADRNELMTACVEAPRAPTRSRSLVSDNLRAENGRWWLWGWVCIWPVALVAGLYGFVGRFGIAPPDDGFILAQSRRLLTGQIPHLDFISPRPVGSPLLHCVDFLVPLPLLEASRLVSLAEFVTFSLCLATLIFGVGPLRWSGVQVAGAITATIINLHTFPLMAWHTVDGLTLISVGWVVLERALTARRPRRARAAMVVLGMAVVVKQSFGPAPLIAALLMRRAVRRSPSDGLIGPGEGLLWAAIPSVAYVAVVSAAGGFWPMAHQILGARPVYGMPLISVLWRAGSFPTIAVTGGAALAGLAVYAHRSHAVKPDLSRRIQALAAVAVGFAALGIPLTTRTNPAASWARALVLLLAIVVVWEWAVDHVVDHVALILICAAWMASLSWGYPTPRLVAGSIALALAARLWPRMPHGRRGWIPAGTAVAVALAMCSVSIAQRSEAPFLNNTTTHDDQTLGQVVAELGDIRADHSATIVLRTVADCHQRYPTRWTAVLPGPALVYPALRLDNPLPADWIYPPELHGSTRRLLAAAQHLDTAGNYLVLYNPQATGITAQLVSALHGEPVTCGPLIGVYRPATR